MVPVVRAGVDDERRPAAATGDRGVAWYAEQQHGVIGRPQLLACGITRAGIEHRTRVGRLHRLHRGVYAVGHRLVSSEGTAMAAVLAVSPDALVSHGTAARLWSILPAGTRERADEQVDVTVIGRNPGVRPGVRRHRVGSLDPRDLRWIGPIPVTSAARTVLDLAASTTAAFSERALAEAIRAGLTSEGEARSLMARSPGHPGLRTLGCVLCVGPAFDRSVAERLLVELLRRSGLPRAATNATVAGFEVDVVWRDQRVVAEFDGYAFHGDRFAFRRDRRKLARLQAAGYRVVPIVWEDLHDHPETVVAVLATVLAVAGGERRSGAAGG
ncbi:type IV toxin-antitoxin system AbiEi family antitoxin domain-containing protein [Patulibacter defluvii]|uniref:type IV toxin-antitoxin system AbiEi family antitoxin domain-containing protein n=1 Tax=Patulibacter defluvii TaxID=3095358 RepID=UPI002A759851|nr:type IV toxin-antitoxin system AbiEi family antitoxin domain-containing protein [Patulibacter sp. DM4]